MNAVGRLRRRVRRRLRGVPARPSRPQSSRPRPKDPEFLFVVTYGRSGSTLLQGLLNSLPRVLVRGENSFFVLPLYRAMTQAMDFRHLNYMNRPLQVQSAVYGLRSIRPFRFARATRRLVADTLLGGLPRTEFDVIGFKEIRWHEIEPDETEGFFRFMDQAFPGAKYLLHERANREHVATSGFWRAVDENEAYAAIDRTEEILEYLRRTRPGRTHDSCYEDITSQDRAVSDDALRGIAEFVVSRCDDDVVPRMRETLAVGHGPYAFLGRVRRGVAADEGSAGS